MVEFALVLPVLLLVLLGTVDAGVALVYTYDCVSNAAREGGRTAMVKPIPVEVRTKASEQATALGIPSTDPGGCPAAGGRRQLNRQRYVFVLRLKDGSTACPTASIGCTAVVAVKWEYRAITPIIEDLDRADARLRHDSPTRREGLYQRHARGMSTMITGVTTINRRSPRG